MKITLREKTMVFSWKKRAVVFSGAGQNTNSASRIILWLGIMESDLLKWIVTLCAMTLFGGCATKNYNSSHSAIEVSECIAAGWRKSAFSGVEVPVSITRTEQCFFVGVGLHPTFPSLVITGTEHPFYAVWAEVRDADQGSSTKYHRAYQFSHGVIDRVVDDCQSGKE